MRKKPCIAMILFAAILLSGCKSGGQSKANVINANSYDGASFETTAVSTAAPIPEKSASESAEIITTVPVDIDFVHISDESEQTSVHILEESEQTIVPTSETTVETTTAPPVTTIAATTTTAVTTTVTTTTTAVTTAATSATTSETTTVTTTTTAETTTILEETDLPDFSQNSYKPLNYSEVKGIWISYIEISDFLTGKTESQFRANIGAAYDKCVGLGLNTVYVHARAFCDAFYDSELFPLTKYVTGSYGSKMSFDPLKIMVDEAHKRGLSFQAWINPLRAYSDADISSVKSGVVKEWYDDDSKRGKYIVKVGSYWYLNPAYKEVTDLVGKGAAEIASNYDVDGLHIDDYFYPTTDSSFDASAFANSGYSDLSEFRLANCDRLVKSIYDNVKAVNKNALFGISTQGNVTNNLTQLYANVEKWATNKGYADYFAPQIYYGFEHSSQDFVKVLTQWQKMVEKSGADLIPGLSIYKIGEVDTWAEWQNYGDIIKRQIEAARETHNYGGIVLYSYKYVFGSGKTSAMNTEIEAFKPLLTE